jgi:transcriptional regulator with XRE-family HTH domain
MLERSGLKIMNNVTTPYPPNSYKPRNTDEPHTEVKVVAPFLLLAGTGGVITAHSTEVLHRWIHDPRIHIERPALKNIDMRSPAEHVANIRDIFAINMSDLASILGVTRPTVYAWLEGQEPKAEAVIRIQQWSHTADQIKQANIVRLDKLVHRPILNGRSLLDMLKADENPSEALAKLKAIADKEAQTRREPKGSGKKLRSLDDVLSESSIATDERS